MVVRYVPLMLHGSARTWLNILPPESVNSWLDFEEVFNRNFTGTYLRPGNTQLLSMCRQKDGESDRAYLTRWTSLRNSCEGILELQAVQYFIQGCRDGTLLRVPNNNSALTYRYRGMRHGKNRFAIFSDDFDLVPFFTPQPFGRSSLSFVLLGSMK